MRKHPVFVGALALAALLARRGDGAPAAGSTGGPSASRSLPHPASPIPSREAGRLEGIDRRLLDLPFAFVENVGQWRGPARFIAHRGEAATVYLEPSALTLRLVRRETDLASAGGVNIRLSFEGARDGVSMVGLEPLPTSFNYFLGNDPTRWRMGVRGYPRVACRGLYEGVDLVVREADALLEYDVFLAPGADLSRVVVQVEGAGAPLRLEEAGTLVIETALGEIRQPAPKAWEEVEPGGPRPIECTYRILGEDRFGFEAPGRGEGHTLVVDPQLLYSTFLGGTNLDEAYAVALDGTGAAVVAGMTGSVAFPTTPGAFDTTLAASDAFLTRLPLSGGPPSYSTFFGGSLGETAYALALDATGAAVVGGLTSSADFPTTPGASDTTSGGADAFVALLPPSGGPPFYSTFLGGSGVEWILALAADPTGNAVVAGRTVSSDFPTTPGGFDTTIGGGPFDDGFVARVPLAGGPLSYSTFLGGTGTDIVYALALDSAGDAVLSGQTGSPNFPTTPGAFDTSFGGSNDGFVTRLPLSGGPPSASTFLGGGSPDNALALALDTTGAAVVAGLTGSSGFPTTPGAFLTTFNANPTSLEAFVTRLSPSGASLAYSSFLGGAQHEYARALRLDATGAAVVFGSTNSPDFPTTPGAFDTTGVYYECFVTRLPLSSGPPFYSTFIGGFGFAWPYSLALDSTGAAVLAGWTNAPDFPTTPGAFDTTFNGATTASDAFVSHLELLPTGASTYGTSTPGCAGPLPIGATSIPQVGNASFAVTCGHAPPLASGFFGLSLGGLTIPLVFGGLAVWIDPFAPLFFEVLVPSDPIGAASVPLPIPSDPGLAGLQVFAQFAWVDACAPGGLSGSNALAILAQP